MRKIYAPFLLLFSVVFLAKADYQTYDSELWRGTDYCAADSSIITYAVPTDFPFTTYTPSVNVSVDNVAYVGMYSDVNMWNKTVNFGYFDMKDSTTATITISTKSNLSSYTILPHNAAVEVVARNSSYLKIKVLEPNQNITVVLNNNYKGEAVHLFCNKVEPKPYISRRYNEKSHFDSETQTYYFGPGYWDLTTMTAFNGNLTASATRKVYIAPGAVVRGHVGISSSTEGANCAKVYGHGIVVADKDVGSGPVSFSWTNAGHLEGIIAWTFHQGTWQTTYTESRNITVNNFHVIGTYGPCTDGMDLTRVENATFDNVFIRSCDDGVAIKGLYDESVAIEDCPPNENIHFNNLQIWSDCNNAFGIGAETRAKYMKDIKLTNSYILFSYDDKTNHDKLDERSAMNICCLHGTTFEDILFENIYVNKCERLIGLGFKDNFWFGSIIGDQSTEGGIKGVTFRDIECPYISPNSMSANDIRLYGWEKDGTPSKYVEDITFENVNIEGKVIGSLEDKHFDIPIPEYVRNVIFKKEATTVESTTIIPGNRIEDNRWFNLQGVEIEKPNSSGIYIHNGQKFLIK